MGRAAVPSGASTGAHEAVELRDGDKSRYLGKGVLKAVDNVNGEIFDALVGMDAEDQRGIDAALIQLDGTHEQEPPRRQRHPRRVAGRRQGCRRHHRPAALPLRRRRDRARSARADDEHHQRRRACRQPDRHPGIHDHAGRRAETCAEAMRMGAEIFHTLKKTLKDAGHNTNVGDEGGFAPNLKSADEALGFIMKAIEKAGYKPGDDVMLALDCASTEFFKDGKYDLEGEGKTLDRGGHGRSISPTSSPRYPDHLHRGRHGRGRLGRLEGADRSASARRSSSSATTCSSPTPSASRRASRTGIANSILVKVNQIGSLTETLDAVEHGPARRLHRRHVPPLGRDRGLDHRRPRGRHQLRPDQDRLALPLRPHRQVQPAHPHRRANSATIARYAGRSILKAGAGA